MFYLTPFLYAFWTFLCVPVVGLCVFLMPFSIYVHPTRSLYSDCFFACVPIRACFILLNSGRSRGGSYNIPWRKRHDDIVLPSVNPPPPFEKSWLRPCNLFSASIPVVAPTCFYTLLDFYFLKKFPYHYDSRFPSSFP